MQVDLSTLKPNPFRDFKVDPIDDEAVAELVKSIDKDGFWGGVVCRRVKGGIEIAAGHHRVEAAKKAKNPIERADVFVGDFDDTAMIRIYATENATQRGAIGTALTGSVAAVMKHLLRQELRGSLASKRPSGQGQIANGIGQDRILAALSGVPGITDNVIRQQLANLHASGDYDRIVDEVTTAIEAESREALKALEAAEHQQRETELKAKEAESARKIAAEAANKARQKETVLRAELKAAQAEKDAVAAERARERAAAAENQRKQAEEVRRKAEAAKKLADTNRKAAEAEEKKHVKAKSTRDAVKRARSSKKHEITFDLAGVSKWLKNPKHVEVFRKIVTGSGIKPYLPVSGQADLASDLVAYAKKQDRELTSGYLHERVTELLVGSKYSERKQTREEEQALLRRNWVERAKRYEDDFGRSCRGFTKAALDRIAHEKKRPAGEVFGMTAEFKRAVTSATESLAEIKRIFRL